MLMQILARTPSWVFALFAALLALGLSQARARQVPLVRALALPAAMVGLSGWGVGSAFGGTGGPLATWLAAGLLCGSLVLRGPVHPEVRYDAMKRRFLLPGSWVPLVLILGIFCTKYAVGVSLAMHPTLAMDDGFALATSAVYGAFSGVFAGRALGLLRLSRRLVE